MTTEREKDNREGKGQHRGKRMTEREVDNRNETQ